jgi:hypothetical protein
LPPINGKRDSIGDQAKLGDPSVTFGTTVLQ